MPLGVPPGTSDENIGKWKVVHLIVVCKNSQRFSWKALHVTSRSHFVLHAPATSVSS